jgi:HTH-type transcriptional regulator / antitoxin HigA
LTAREHAVAAWVRETEIAAKELNVAAFDEKRLWALLDELRKLSRRNAVEIMSLVQKICAQAGVAVVLVLAPQGTGISGCARWLNDKRALVGLTPRYRTDDQLWFALFHEIGRILLHRRKRPFVVDNAAEDLSDRVVDPEMEQYEMEANRFSADRLIPPKSFDAFIRKGVFTNDSIHDFAKAVDVGPGIVAGRLQYEGILGRHQGNALKQRLNWTVVDERKAV